MATRRPSRSRPKDPSLFNDTSSTESDPLLPSSSTYPSSTATASTAVLAQRRRTRKRQTICVLLLLIVVLPYCLKWRSRNIRAKRERDRGAIGWDLGESYALCSGKGQGPNVYTSDELVPRAECVVVDRDHIVYVGDRSTVRKTYSSYKIKFITPGSIITAGFVDSHAHTLEYGWSRQLPLLGSPSVDSVIEKLEAFVRAHKEEIEAGAWVEGLGWDQTKWEGGEFPTSADFDRSPLLRGLPIALKRIDVHAEWLSTRALELLGPLPSATPGGQILRFPDGTPTGVFLDDAMFLIDAVRPGRTEAQMEGYLSRAVGDAVSKGLTGIHDAGVPPSEVNFFLRMSESGKLPIKFYLMRACPDKDQYCGDEFPKVESKHMIVNSVKLFGDGALGSWGAALLEPYSDRADQSGTMRSEDEVWKPLIRKFVENGWQVNVHCIGDKANHLVIDAMEYALQVTNKTHADVRLRIEHAQIMTPADLARAARLGIIASFQPTHATSDMWYAEDRLGPERIKGAYAWQTYLEQGGRITLGSDFPVEDVDPLYGFFSAVARTDHEMNSPHGPDGWYPSQKLSRMEALRGMTIDPAFASFQDNITGSLTPGKKADLVVWSKDLLEVPPEQILTTRVLATIVDGIIVYKAD